MRLVTFEQHGRLRPGILADDGVIDIGTAWPGPDAAPVSIGAIIRDWVHCAPESLTNCSRSAINIPMRS